MNNENQTTETPEKEPEKIINEGEVKEVVKKVVASVSRRMIFSETIGNFALALSKAQGAMHAVSKGKTGYGYKYSDLASVLEVLRKPFADNELCIVQGHELLKGTNPSVVTYSRIIHSSGEWTESALEIPLTAMKGLSPAQTVGVVSTYAKRYLIQAQAGLASEDTDAALTK